MGSIFDLSSLVVYTITFEQQRDIDTIQILMIRASIILISNTNIFILMKKTICNAKKSQISHIATVSKFVYYAIVYMYINFGVLTKK